MMTQWMGYYNIFSQMKEWLQKTEICSEEDIDFIIIIIYHISKDTKGLN